MKTNSASPDTADKGGSFFVSQPTRAINQVIPVRPEFIRLPRAGALCAWTGLSRSKLNDLILPRNGQPPQVKSFNVRKKHQRKGTRLIVLDSLLKTLNTMRREQGAE